MSLRGWQVKAIKARQVSLHEAYAYIKGGEVYLRGLSLTPIVGLNDFERETAHQDIKLLLHRGEIDRMFAVLGRKGEGVTLIPSKLFSDRGLIKITLNVARGKKKHDKRQSIKERELERESRTEGQKYF